MNWKDPLDWIKFGIAIIVWFIIALFLFGLFTALVAS